MDKSKLFQIGEISKMFNLGVGILRHYEKYGLLKPEYINKESGYRYYSTQQFEVLNTIKYLRMLGLSLGEIADFLENREVEKIQQMLLAQKNRVVEKQKELKIIEKKIDNRLKSLQSAIESKIGVVEIKTIEPQRLIMIRKNLEISSYVDADFEKSIKEFGQNQSEAMVFLGKVGLGISKEKLMKKQYDCYDRVFLLLDAEDNCSKNVKCFPEQTCLTFKFCGSHKDAKKYYKKLEEYIEKEKLEIVGFSREVSLIDYGFTNDTSKFVTEIQIPVAYK